jgi:hypothetical protein
MVMPDNMPRERYLQYTLLASVLRRRARQLKDDRDDFQWLVLKVVLSAVSLGALVSLAVAR